MIDRWGSMSGEPLEAVLPATSQLARLLPTDDRLAIVTFDDTVDFALPGGPSRRDLPSTSTRYTPTSSPSTSTLPPPFQLEDDALEIEYA